MGGNFLFLEGGRLPKFLICDAAPAQTQQDKPTTTFASDRVDAKLLAGVYANDADESSRAFKKLKGR